MTHRLRLLYASMAALLLGAVIFLAYMRPACTCVLGGHYDNPDDPADCQVHGSVTP